MKSKNLIIICLGVISCLVLGLNIWLWWQKNNSLPTVTNLPEPSLPPTVSAPTLKFSYTGSLPSFAEAIPIYKEGTELLLTKDKAFDYARGFEMLQPPTLSKGTDKPFYIFKETTKYLGISAPPIQINYSNTDESTNQKLSKTEINEAAQQFLSQFNFAPYSINIKSPLIQPITTLRSGEGYFDATWETATLIRILYNVTIDEYPIITQEHQNPPVELLLNLDGSIKKAVITFFPTAPEKIGQTNITKVEEALEALNNGQGQISKLESGQRIFTFLEPGEISVANLSNVDLIYVYNSINKLFQPYYRFSGNAQTKTGENIEVEVLITALPQEVFKK